MNIPNPKTAKTKITKTKARATMDSNKITRTHVLLNKAVWLASDK